LLTHLPADLRDYTRFAYLTGIRRGEIAAASMKKKRSRRVKKVLRPKGPAAVAGSSGTWKPNYRFEVPAAIVDPNGNIQALSGIKQPNGSTLTDFRYWNVLTKHFGDQPD
jgi:hypothetical protein